MCCTDFQVSVLPVSSRCDDYVAGLNPCAVKDAEEMYAAMECRGFTGSYTFARGAGLRAVDSAFIAANALVLNPDVLVRDEPMNGLDPRTEHFLRDFFVQLRSAGKTIICATHDFEYVDGVFDRAAVFSMRHERVREGPYGEIIGDRDFLRGKNIV